MACSALFILMIMSSSICRHFFTFPFVKLIEQFNELKSFRRREKNSHPSIITVIKSDNHHLAVLAPVTGLQPPWAWELLQGLRKVKQSIPEPLCPWPRVLRLLCLGRERMQSSLGPGCWASEHLTRMVKPCQAGGGLMPLSPP